MAPNMSSASYVGNYGTNGFVTASAASQNVSWQITRFAGGATNSLNPASLMNSQGVGPLFNNSRVTLASVTDGSSNTILLGERRGDLNDSVPSNPFIRPGDTFWAGGPHYLVVASAYYKPNKCNRKTVTANLDGCVGTFSSLHPGGLQMCLIDGSVRFISDTIDSADEATLDAIPNIQSPANAYGAWQAICVINDGTIVKEF
jgi:hypothetical protein